MKGFGNNTGTIATTTGVSDADKIVKTNSQGTIDASFQNKKAEIVFSKTTNTNVGNSAVTIPFDSVAFTNNAVEYFNISTIGNHLICLKDCSIFAQIYGGYEGNYGAGNYVVFYHGFQMNLLANDFRGWTGEIFTTGGAGLSSSGQSTSVMIKCVQGDIIKALAQISGALNGQKILGGNDFKTRIFIL